MPDPHHLIHQQILWHGMSNKHHRHFSLELVNGRGEVFGSGAVQAAGRFVENEYLGLLDQRVYQRCYTPCGVEFQLPHGEGVFSRRGAIRLNFRA